MLIRKVPHRLWANKRANNSPEESIFKSAGTDNTEINHSKLETCAPSSIIYGLKRKLISSTSTSHIIHKIHAWQTQAHTRTHVYVIQLLSTRTIVKVPWMQNFDRDSLTAKKTISYYGDNE